MLPSFLKMEESDKVNVLWYQTETDDRNLLALNCIYWLSLEFEHHYHDVCMSQYARMFKCKTISLHTRIHNTYLPIDNNVGYMGFERFSRYWL